MKICRRSRTTLYCVLKTCIVLLTVSLALAMCIVLLLKCSNEKANKQVQALRNSYRRGEVAGSMCNELLNEDRLSVSHCGGNTFDKTVVVMRCSDCVARLIVLKSKFDLEQWTSKKQIYFSPHESINSMIDRSNELIFNRFRFKFKTDISNHSDVLSYLWGQSFNDFIHARRKMKDNTLQLSSVALQSIVSLSMQEEYGCMLLMKHASIMPKMYGTCGPAYFVEYTPSIVYLGYVKYLGKIPEALNRPPKAIKWHERVHVALQLLRILTFLETLDPPVFMCDLQAHNFGLDHRGKVVILDVDSLEFDNVVPHDRVCGSDADCSFLSCIGRCDVTSHTCVKGPVNSHLQVVCRNIFLSYVPAFGLLREPPAYVALELGRLLDECSFHPKKEFVPWKSNVLLQRKLTALLHSSLQ